MRFLFVALLLLLLPIFSFAGGITFDEIAQFPEEHVGKEFTFDVYVSTHSLHMNKLPDYSKFGIYFFRRDGSAITSAIPLSNNLCSVISYSDAKILIQKLEPGLLRQYPAKVTFVIEKNSHSGKGHLATVQKLLLLPTE